MLLDDCLFGVLRFEEDDIACRVFGELIPFCSPTTRTVDSLVVLEVSPPRRGVRNRPVLPPITEEIPVVVVVVVVVVLIPPPGTEENEG